MLYPDPVRALRPVLPPLALAVGGAALAVLFETAWVRTTRVRSPGGGGARLVQISDLHGRGRFLNGRLADLVNRLRPDAVFVTGDLATDHADLDAVLAELARLTCPHVLFVPGNYEREDGAHGRKRALGDAEYAALLDRIGRRTTVLANRGVTLDLGGRRVWVYGFDNSRYGEERAPDAVPEGVDRVVLLAHSPSVIGLAEARVRRWDALLVGHTHGGQVRFFGRTVGPYRHFRPGANPARGGLFHVNRGLGTTRLPLRWGSPPEILLVEA